MKKTAIILLILVLIGSIAIAKTDYFKNHAAYLSKEAITAAIDTTIPSTLSVEEHDIFRLGFAYGYDAGIGTQMAVSRYRSDAPAVTFIANMNSKTFHKPSCSYVNSILLENRRDFTCTYIEMLEQGFYPCGRCIKDE